MNWQIVQTKIPMVKEATSVKVKDPKDIKELCKDLSDLAQECFQVITINAKNNLIDRHLVCLGLLDASLVHPREVFRNAILDNAKAIICVHNHPSGDPTPSAEDIRITRQLIQASKIIDIQLFDHIIIGKENGNATCLSMRETGMLDFS